MEKSKKSVKVSGKNAKGDSVSFEAEMLLVAVGRMPYLEGLGLEPGRHALVADDPARLAGAVADVLVDDDLARRLAAEGGRHARERFGWDDIGRRFVDALVAQTQAR